MPNVGKIKRLLVDCKKNNVRNIRISNENGNKTTEVEFDTLSKYRMKSLKHERKSNKNRSSGESKQNRNFSLDEHYSKNRYDSNIYNSKYRK